LGHPGSRFQFFREVALPVLGYVVNTYPRPSHSFIRREIRALEAAGWTVHRFAMRGDATALVDADDRAEHERTERVLEAGALHLALNTLRAFAQTGPAARRALHAAR